MDDFPVLGAYERRLGWFEESYRAVLDGGRAAR